MPDTIPKKGGDFRRLTESDVVVGEPLRWPVHDENGSLLLAKGFVVKSQLQRQRLINQRVYIQASNRGSFTRDRTGSGPEDDPRVYKRKGLDVFTWFDTQYAVLESSYALLAQGPSEEGVAQIRNLAVALLNAAEKNPNGLLAAAFLSRGKRYSHTKAFHVALLSNELARVCSLSKEARLSLIAAGLTHDVAFWQLQDEIQLREEPLSDEQWQVIRGHCSAGVGLLQQSGVKDPAWLEAVEQHHERLNGSGYHAGLQEAAIGQLARILAIADVFAAMVRTRGDRGKRMPKDAMREIFMSRGEDIDGTLVQLFIKKVGMFPPGCALRLVTNEIGIATGSGISAASPEVEVVIDAAGKPLTKPLYRDTNSKSFAVKELVREVEHPDLHKLLVDMWDKLPLPL